MFFLDIESESLQFDNGGVFLYNLVSLLLCLLTYFLIFYPLPSYEEFSMTVKYVNFAEHAPNKTGACSIHDCNRVSLKIRN